MCEKARERQRFLIDYQLGMNAAKHEGVAIGKAELITHILTKRFESVSKEIEEKLLAITDLEKLDKLADFAFDCQSLEEFGIILNK